MMKKTPQPAFAPNEYQQRHPIQVAEGERHIDIFGSGHNLDMRQKADVIAFVKEYKDKGIGAIQIVAPGNNVSNSSIEEIYTIFKENGVKTPPNINYGYDAGSASPPIRLSFLKMQAKVASECGLWPSDLTGSKNLETWQNRPYYNLGCSTQSMLAAQIDDPIDLIRPRAEGKIDAIKRKRSIESLREGKDPSTSWNKDDATTKGN